MKSYVKIYGPPLGKAIKALEKVAIDLHNVCVWDTIMALSPEFIKYGDGSHTDIAADVTGYFAGLGEVPIERCSTIISKSGEALGEYDFYFEWFKKPTTDELNSLIDKVDEALAPLGVKYTLTTK